MSHQTGIRVSGEVVSEFARSKEAHSSTAFLVLRIESETSIVTHARHEGPSPATSHDDAIAWNWNALQSHLSATQPLFILFRLHPAQWIFIAYVPDAAKVREKMLYAASKAAITKELGDVCFVDSLYATHPNDLSLDAYHTHRQAKVADKPLTEKEAELQRIKLAECGVDIGASTRRAHVAGIQFPITEKAIAALEDLKREKVDFVQLLIRDETIDLATTVASLKSMSSAQAFEATFKTLPKDAPRFSIFRWSFVDSKPCVFLYSCPLASPVRERMLYSSTRTALLSALESLSISISKKLEISELAEWNLDMLSNELGGDAKSPSAASTPPPSHGFVKKTVAGPGGGGRRLIRTNKD